MLSRCTPLLVLLALTLLLAAACTSDDPASAGSAGDATAPATTSEATPVPSDPGRSYAMGFTPYPHDGALQGLLDALEIIEAEADLIAVHYDGGVPWIESLAGAPWPAAYRAEVEGKANALPDGHLVYLAVTPIAFERDALAPDVGTAGLPAPWNGYALNHPDVIEAYGRFVLRMIDLYDPDYLAYAIEPNIFAGSRPDQWPAFLELAVATYRRIKAAHPDLPAFVSLQAEWYHRDPATQRGLFIDLLAYTDLLAVSSYPYIDGHAAGAIPEGYFAAIRDLAPDKPFAVAETGWPAEPIGEPYPVAIPADEAAQRTFVEWLLEDAAAADAEFVTWFLPRDLDGQWDAGLADSPLAPTARLFRDNGLLAGDGTPRPGLRPLARSPRRALRPLAPPPRLSDSRDRDF